MSGQLGQSSTHGSCQVSLAGDQPMDNVRSAWPVFNPWIISYVDVLITDMFFKDDGIEFSLGEIYTNNVLVASHNDW